MEKTSNKLEVYLDYICPFCYRAYQSLRAIIPEYRDMVIDWRPCETHPRPDNYGKHSDLCIQGFFLCRDSGGDTTAYNDLMYKAVFVDHINIEDTDELADYASALIDPLKFREAIVSGKYKAELQANNNRAWAELRLEAVPSFRLGEKKLCAVLGVGVAEDKLKKFLSECFKNR